MLLNVNTPADGRRAEAALGRGVTRERRESCAHTLPAIVCVIGKKKSGKTTTTVGLVRELMAPGPAGHDRQARPPLRAGHGRAPTPGAIGWKAGAHRVVMAGPEQLAVMGEWGDGRRATLEELVVRFLADADVVVAEGFKTSSAPKIEVFRRATHAQPLYGADADV